MNSIVIRYLHYGQVCYFKNHLGSQNCISVKHNYTMSKNQPLFKVNAFGQKNNFFCQNKVYD